MNRTPEESPPPRTPTAKPHGEASTSASDSGAKPAVKVSPPPPPPLLTPRPATSPHVVVDVAEEHDDQEPTPGDDNSAPRPLPPTRNREPAASPPSSPAPPTTKPYGEASTSASESDGKVWPPPSPPLRSAPPHPATSPHVRVDVVEEHKPKPTPAVHNSVPRLLPPPPAPTRNRKPAASPPTPTTNRVPDDKAPPPPPPPPPPALTRNPAPAASPQTQPPPPPPTTSGIHGDKIPPPPPLTQTDDTTTPTASKASKMSSTVNPISLTSSRSSEVFEDEDKLRHIELALREQALEEEIKLAKKLRNDNEIKRRNDEIALRQWGEKMDILEDEMATKEQELRRAELRDREKRLKNRENELNNPLLLQLQEDQNQQNKDDDVWDKRQNIMAISLACGLSVLISMQPLFPPEFFKWIVGAFAIVWALAAIAFPTGLFGTYRLEKDFSRHVSRLTFMSFSLFVLYILYILSQPTAPRSSGLAPSPPQQVPSEDFNAMFYILLGFLTLIGHIALWVLGCVTGGDKDP